MQTLKEGKRKKKELLRDMKNINRENRNKKELLLQMKMLFQKYFFPVRHQNHYTLQHLLVLTIMTRCHMWCGSPPFFILKPKESKRARSKQQDGCCLVLVNPEAMILWFVWNGKAFAPGDLSTMKRVACHQVEIFFQMK